MASLLQICMFVLKISNRLEVWCSFLWATELRTDGTGRPRTGQQTLITHLVGIQCTNFCTRFTLAHTDKSPIWRQRLRIIDHLLGLLRVMADVISPSFASPEESGISMFPTPVIHQTSEREKKKGFTSRKQKQRCTHALSFTHTHVFACTDTHKQVERTEQMVLQIQWSKRVPGNPFDTSGASLQFPNEARWWDGAWRRSRLSLFPCWCCNLARTHTHTCHTQHRARYVLFFLRVIGLLRSEVLSSMHWYRVGFKMIRHVKGRSLKSNSH